MISVIKTTRGARCTAGVFRVADRLLTRKTMAKAIVLFREVDIKGAVLPEKVVLVDKNKRRWISCRGLTTAVAESHSTFVRRLLTMINRYRSTL